MAEQAGRPPISDSAVAEQASIGWLIVVQDSGASSSD